MRDNTFFYQKRQKQVPPGSVRIEYCKLYPDEGVEVV